MSVARVLVVALMLFGILARADTSHGQSGGVQPLLLGDRPCADTANACVFAGVVPQHRYLHVVIHDQPNTYDWRIQIGTGCDTLTDAAGWDAIAPSGYLEQVIDLGNLSGIPYPSPVCIVLRGGEGFENTYYAAYLDDSAVPDADSIYLGYQSLAGRPDLPDLDVAFIHRTPAFAYDGHPNEPAPGQAVTFEAVVVNAGALEAPPFTYAWRLDGRVADSGSVAQPLAPGQSMTLSMPWRWQDDPHTLSFELQTPGQEISTSNDTLSIRTNALTLGFWVERSAYDFFRQHQWTYCRDFGCGTSDSLEDWLQRQVSAWNSILAASGDPTLAPAGIADRVRVDAFHVVPDGALPLHGGIATNNPDSSDHSVDLEWGMPAADVQHGFPLHQNGPFNLQWALLHELGHARSLVDLYRFDVPVTSQSRIDVTAADGAPAFDASNPTDPQRPLHAYSVAHDGLFLYRNEEADLMSCDCQHFYSPYDILALNRIRNRRALCGNANPPCNIGDWLLEWPPVNRLRLLDAGGKPLGDGATVIVYRDTNTSYNAHTFDDAHSYRLVSAHRTVTLPPDPFDASTTYLAGHNLLLIDVRAGTTDTYCFAEPTVFTLAYWEGYRTAAHPATYTLRVGNGFGNGCDLTGPAALLNEPFATSPSASTAVDTGMVSGGSREVRIHLADDATPTNPMRNRSLVVLDEQGRHIGSGTTDRSGRAEITMRRTARPTRVVDSTDNNLTITVRPPAPPR